MSQWTIQNTETDGSDAQLHHNNAMGIIIDLYLYSSLWLYGNGFNFANDFQVHSG